MFRVDLGPWAQNLQRDVRYLGKCHHNDVALTDDTSCCRGDRKASVRLLASSIMWAAFLLTHSELPGKMGHKIRAVGMNFRSWILTDGLIKKKNLIIFVKNSVIIILVSILLAYEKQLLLSHDMLVLRNQVVKFLDSSPQMETTSKDVLVTSGQCTMCTSFRDSLTKLTFRGVQKPQLAVARWERCPSLFTDITQGLTPCINTAAKAGKFVAIRNVGFLFSECLTTLAKVRSTAYVPM